jgi:hypothetical protein
MNNRSCHRTVIDEITQVTIVGKTLDELNSECRKECTVYMNFKERACKTACPRLLSFYRCSGESTNET